MCRFHDSDGRRSDQPSSPAHNDGPLSVDAWHHDVPRGAKRGCPIAQGAARWSATPSTDNAIRERGPDACRTTPVRTERQGSAQWHPGLAQEMEAAATRSWPPAAAHRIQCASGVDRTLCGNAHMESCLMQSSSSQGRSDQCGRRALQSGLNQCRGCRSAATPWDRAMLVTSARSAVLPHPASARRHEHRAG